MVIQLAETSDLLAGWSRIDTVYRWLNPGGVFVLSVEHPIFTALAAQEWCLGPAGERLHWPVDDYQKEAPRRTQWMVDDVVKYHRATATLVNTLIDCGFRITRLLEPQPTAEMLRQQPDWRDEVRRPMLILLSGAKPGTNSSACH